MKKSLYVLQDGELRRRDNSLYFESGSGRKFIPVESTNDIYILGNVNVSGRFLEFASQKQICIHYFDNSGIYIGTFYPREYYSSGHVIVKQIEHYLDHNKRLILAKKFASAAVGQMLRVIKYYRTRLPEEYMEPIRKKMLKLERYIQDIDNIVGIDELNTVVHIARDEYTGTFYYIFRNPYFSYDLDDKDSGYNHINAIKDFGDSLCQAIILSEVYKTFLDPKISYLSKVDSSKFILNVDLTHIFTPILIDRMLFTLANKKIIKRRDFKGTKDKPMLSREGKTKILKYLDNRLKTTIKHRNLGRSVSYRRLIRLEIYKLQKHILGKKEYRPYESLW